LSNSAQQQPKQTINRQHFVTSDKRENFENVKHKILVGRIQKNKKETITCITRLEIPAILQQYDDENLLL